MRIVMSSGHGKYIRGASGYLDEVDEARRVVDSVAGMLSAAGMEIHSFHDNVSTTQDENLDRIVDYHNSKTRDLDVSVHFNAYETNSKPMGSEVWFYTQETLSAQVSRAIANAAGLPDRGAKPTTGLYFLNHTEEPAILIETCFVDSSVDAERYQNNFEDICQGIAAALRGEETQPIPPELPDWGAPVFRAQGPCSYFGGPRDTGVSPSEGLALYSDLHQAPWLFLPIQPAGTTGLARRLNPATHYIACRWDYDVTPKNMLVQGTCLVRARGMELRAFPADWGPHEDTGRVADLSPSLMIDLGLNTDDEVEVIFPAPSLR